MKYRYFISCVSETIDSDKKYTYHCIELMFEIKNAKHIEAASKTILNENNTYKSVDILNYQLKETIDE